MRILHVYKTYFPYTQGGCEQVIKNLAIHTKKLGCQSTLITASKENKNISFEENSYLKIIRCPTTFEISSCPVSFKLLTQFKKQANNADIIHYHFPWPFADFLQWQSQIKKPIIITYHSDIIKQRIIKPLYKPLMHYFLNRADKIITSSQNYLDSSEDLIPYKNKCSVIPFGIDETDYPKVNEQQLENMAQKVGRNFILFIGVLRYYKGLHILLEAIKNSNIALVIAGVDKNQLPEEYQTLNQIKCLGTVTEEDKVCLLKLCKALILPSHLRSEAFGIVLLEGLLFNKPLISTEINTGTSFVNEDKVTGLVVPPNNASALLKAMQALYDNPTLCESMSQASKKRFNNLFTAQKMALHYYQQYQFLNEKYSCLTQSNVAF